jgi:hypothetical protein
MENLKEHPEIYKKHFETGWGNCEEDFFLRLSVVVLYKKQTFLKGFILLFQKFYFITFGKIFWECVPDHHVKSAKFENIQLFSTEHIF